MNKYVVIVAMVNGMIGGLILVLPILAMYGGTLLSFLVILVTGFFSYYSCYLCVIHLGKHSDLDKAILQHFNQSKAMRIFYDLLVFSNLLFLLMLYFNLIVTQWRGLLPYNLANPICNAVGLVVLTFALNYFHFGTKLLGYGIISIIGYCVFLIWLISTAPSGSNRIPEFGVGAVNLAASMGQAFAIQTFFIPVLRELPDTSKYSRYTLIAYIIGGSVYLYIAFAGSFGILNRHAYIPAGQKPQTIQDYFQRGQWQVNIVEVIYLVHLYSAYGEFLLICKKRFFNICGIKQSKHGEILNKYEIIFVLILIGITVGIFFGNVSISTLIEINGAILGFFFIYLLPAAMHFKCLYINRGKFKNVVILNVQRQISQPLQPSNMLQAEDTNIKMSQISHTGMNKKRQQSVIIELTQRKQSLDSPPRPNDKKREEQQTKRQQNLQDELSIQNNRSEIQDSQIVNASLSANLNNLNHNQSRKMNNHDENLNQSNTNNSPIKKLQTSSTIQIRSCQCQKPKNIMLQVMDILFMVGMVGLGAFIMVDGFISIITGVQS